MSRIATVTAHSLTIAALALGSSAFTATAHAEGTPGATTATSGTQTAQTPPPAPNRGRYQLR